MPVLPRALVLICGALAIASAPAQEAAGGRDAEPDVYAKMRAVQVFLLDGSAPAMARECAQTTPGFMSEFLLRFSAWRAENAKQIALGSQLSPQFKDAQGDPMDPVAAGQLAAQKLRAAAPDERKLACDDLLRGVATAR